ncbi:putative dTDP-4-dehydrorhamnose reductase [Prochlorococcus marinus str. MIT 9313]|uniref:dTDP-4-dehydrorhamnose reductase n=1 Tax=Prochlorococcus marinus (strain MIT 9313) TaxID=74547 RepID=Q7V945_PROMM|nr:putative dTDP-4-dehydrorhamnose reductase [Prochlorococcus marinus str. MIT 9313]
MTIKVLLTGAAGQLGQALQASCPSSVELVSTSRMGDGLLQPLDLADAQACRAAVFQHRPDWVLNAGAYTAVDHAEQEPDLALAVNASAPRALAEGLLETGGRMLQVSTDFVFNGAQGHPYRPNQPRDPLGVYGATKAAGEEAVEQILGAQGRAVTLRTSWVYGPVGRNFLLTMLRLHREREQLNVVVDQVGCPTSTITLATACWALMKEPQQPYLPPVLHWCDAGAASWYDFAVAIGELGVAKGLLQRAAVVNPIITAEYPTPAQRPSYSLLDCSETRQLLGLHACHWRVALEQVIADVES